jgi:hypothetical protein
MRLALLVLFAVLSAPHALQACMCIHASPKGEFKRSSAVFAGEVLSWSWDDNRARMRVIERFKGAEGDVVDVHTEGGCAYTALQASGSRHLIYAYAREDGHLSTSVCSGSHDMRKAQCDLRLLRRHAAWWRSPLSSLRIIHWMRIFRWQACP